MTITLTRQEEQQVEINLPAYYKWGAFYYKILSEDSAIIITDYNKNISIERSDWQKGNTASAAIHGVVITEEEFVAKFNEVDEKVKRELEKAIETDKWNAQEKEVETVNA